MAGWSTRTSTACSTCRRRRSPARISSTMPPLAIAATRHFGLPVSEARYRARPPQCRLAGAPAAAARHAAADAAAGLRALARRRPQRTWRRGAVAWRCSEMQARAPAAAGADHGADEHPQARRLPRAVRRHGRKGLRADHSGRAQRPSGVAPSSSRPGCRVRRDGIDARSSTRWLTPARLGHEARVVICRLALPRWPRAAPERHPAEIAASGVLGAPTYPRSVGLRHHAPLNQGPSRFGERLGVKAEPACRKSGTTTKPGTGPEPIAPERHAIYQAAN